MDGVPQFVDRPDAVFSGILEKERVERMLRGQLGKDAIIVVTNVDSGQHRYEMDLETFVLNARIADGETEDSPDENPDTNSGRDILLLWRLGVSVLASGLTAQEA